MEIVRTALADLRGVARLIADSRQSALRRGGRARTLAYAVLYLALLGPLGGRRQRGGARADRGRQHRRQPAPDLRHARPDRLRASSPWARRLRDHARADAGALGVLHGPRRPAVGPAELAGARRGEPGATITLLLGASPWVFARRHGGVPFAGVAACGGDGEPRRRAAPSPTHARPAERRWRCQTPEPVPLRRPSRDAFAGHRRLTPCRNRAQPSPVPRVARRDTPQEFPVRPKCPLAKRLASPPRRPHARCASRRCARCHVAPGAPRSAGSRRGPQPLGARPQRLRQRVLQRRRALDGLELARVPLRLVRRAGRDDRRQAAAVPLGAGPLDEAVRLQLAGACSSRRR